MSKDLMAKFINPDNIEPFDLVAVGKYIIISRSRVNEVSVGEGSKLVLAQTTKEKEVRELFSRVISIGADVVAKRADGTNIRVGDFCVYGNSMGFQGSGQEAFADYKIVHELNILCLVRDVHANEVTDNILLKERERKSRDTDRTASVAINGGSSEITG